MKKLIITTSIIALIIIGAFSFTKPAKANMWHPPMAPQMWEVIYFSCFDDPLGAGFDEKGSVAYRVYDPSTGESLWRECEIGGGNSLFTWNGGNAFFSAPNGWTAIMSGFGFTSGNHRSQIIVGGVQAEATGEWPDWSIMYTIDLY